MTGQLVCQDSAAAHVGARDGFHYLVWYVRSMDLMPSILQPLVKILPQ